MLSFYRVFSPALLLDGDSAERNTQSSSYVLSVCGIVGGLKLSWALTPVLASDIESALSAEMRLVGSSSKWLYLRANI